MVCCDCLVLSCLPASLYLLTYTCMHMHAHTHTHTHREVIAVNQDPLGVQGRLIKSMALGQSGRRGGGGDERSGATGNSRVYSRPLQNGDVAVALLNVHSFASPHNISFAFKEVSEGGREGGKLSWENHQFLLMLLLK